MKGEAGEREQVTHPSISLPKGGGAIRGIGEKFAANPVTGTGSMSVPIATSPGRSGFGPQLSLSYDSGAGNGPFGVGWSLSLPAITRKTDKGLPQYQDAVDSDVFILSGAEDLVPVLVQDANDKWVEQDLPPRTVDGKTYRVRRYRPRIEGLFARIERWSRIGSPSDVHWRSISRDNILTLYGLDEDSRIADPLDASRIFTWLICETRDDKGNAVLYRYKPEDGLGVDLGNAHERNRGSRDDGGRKANRYLKRIHYGNRTSLLDPGTGQRPRILTRAQIDGAGWMFEVVFDYGEHDAEAPTPNDAGVWLVRSDPFSSYRAGFEVRTTRLCRRVLMFHHIPDLATAKKGYEGLVRSTDFSYPEELDPTNPNPHRSDQRREARLHLPEGGHPDRLPSQQRRIRPAAQPAARRIHVHGSYRSGRSGGSRSREPREPPLRLGRQHVPLDRPSRRGHHRHPHRAGRRLVLQAQPEPDSRQAARRPGAGDGAIRPAGSRGPQAERRPERRRRLHGPGRRRTRRRGHGRSHARPLRA